MYCNRCGSWMEDAASFCPRCAQPAGPPSTAPPMDPAAAWAAEAGRRIAYAGFWRRVLACLIDSLILCAAVLILLVVLVPVFFHWAAFGPRSAHTGAGMFFFCFYFFGLWLYFAGFESSPWQGTPGKRALGLFVTDMRGQPISFARASGRFFGKYLSALILMIGYLMAGFTAKKQALHDLLADCLVLLRN